MVQRGGFDFPLDVPQRINNTLGDASPTFKVQRVSLDSALENEKFGLMGSLLWAVSASDQEANCSVRFNDQTNDGLTFKEAMSVSGFKFNEVYITCAAQSGKYIDFFYCLESEQIRIENPGASFSQVQAVKPSGLGTVADVSIGAVSQGLVLAQNTDRLTALISSINANVGIVRIGDAFTGAGRGVELTPGESIEIETTAPIYAYNTHAALGVTLAVSYTED